MAKNNVRMAQVSPDGKSRVCNFQNTTVREFSLTERYNILELNEIAKSETPELMSLHIKKSWIKQTAYIKAPVVIKQVAKLKEHPTIHDFVVEFYTIDMNNMFDKDGNIILGPLSRQIIDEDGKFTFRERGVQIMGYFSEQ